MEKIVQKQSLDISWRLYLSILQYIFFIASDKDSTSSTGINIPFFTQTHSCIPPQRVAITGSPIAKASKTATEKFSLREGRTNTELQLKIWAISVLFFCPIKRTFQ